MPALMCHLRGGLADFYIAGVWLERGELPEEMAAAYEKQHRSFEALQRSLASLAESLERKVPALPETTTRFTGEGSVSIVTRQVRLQLLHLTWTKAGMAFCATNNE
jgi:hypothetical protein